jgi:hypothetical protein
VGDAIKVAAALAALALVLVAPAAASERELTYRDGPYDLGPFQTIRPKVIVRSPPMNGSLTHMTARLVDGAGRPVTVRRVMLHHIVFINRGRFAGDRRPKCGTRFGEPFYGTGEEGQSLDLPQGYGYRLRKGDKWKMQTMLMSHSSAPQRVFVEYSMRVTPQWLEAVTPYWVRVTNCRDDPSYSVPGGGRPGSVHLTSRLWRMPADGYIVAGGAHLHGGANNITLRQPACRGRRLMQSDPSYGMPDDVVYDVQPVLHEPGPVNTTWYSSARGIPVRRGERLRATANYDARYAHPGVMGVWHIYVAHRRVRGRRCAPLPADSVEKSIAGPVRPDPPRVIVPLTRLDGDTPVPLEHPEGRLWWYASPLDRPRIDVDDGAFGKVNLSVAAGTILTWAFDDPEPHKVSLANGPRSMGSPTLSGGREYRRIFTVPGVYQLFCYLHPMTMHQELTVRPSDSGTPDPAEGSEAEGIDEDEPF